MITAPSGRIDLLEWRRIASWAGVAGLVAVWIVLLILQPEVTSKPFGVDARAYHSAPSDNPYGGPPVGMPGAYLYPPPFIQALLPLRLLPWEVFIALYVAAELVALAWLLSPPIALLSLAIPPVLAEVTIGNVHLFMAVAIVLAVRHHPAAWAFLALTKPSVVVVGTWHLLRGQWGEAAVGAGMTLGIAAVSVLVGFDLWVAWVERMTDDTDTAGPVWMASLVARMALASMIVAVAAWRQQPAFLPIAAFVALPIPWLEGLTLLAAVPRLLRSSHRPPRSPRPAGGSQSAGSVNR